MDYIKLIDNKPEPYSATAFRADNKHTVYGSVISNKHLNAQGVYRVRKLPKPVEIGKRAIANTLPELVEGEWVVGWKLVSLDEEKSRELRGELLSACDWTQLQDAPVDKEAWAAYRQALRDITDQPGFPHDVSWPKEPV